MWNKVVCCKHWRSAALLLSLSGCTSLSDCKYELGQKIRTGQAWHEFDGCNEQCFTIDYRDGWKQGYYDVLTGGDGRPPLVPPKKYWKPPVFVQHDPSRQNDWFIGYQDGAANAKCQPDFHYVPTFLPAHADNSAYLHQEPPTLVPFESSEAHLRQAEIPPSESETDPLPDGSEPSDANSSGMPMTEPNQPSGDPEKDSSKEYEKDPEASSTQLEHAGDSAVAKLVANNAPPTNSLLQQLISQAGKEEESQAGSNTQ